MANKNVMAIYLWQMVPVVVVALVGYPTGLLPQPQPGSGAWWLFRVVWLAILAVVAGGTGAAVVGAGGLQSGVAIVRHSVARVEYGSAADRRHGVVTFVLARFSVDGFAPGGRFPTVEALLFVAAVGMISLVPGRLRANTPGRDGHHGVARNVL